MNPLLSSIRILACASALLFTGLLQGQVSINPTGAAPNANAGLDVDFTNRGFLPPRLALSSTASASPLSAHVAGMVVYNTATAGDVTPGMYYNNGTAWVSMTPSGGGCASAPAAPVASAATGYHAVLTASWAASSGATGYFLDVATDAGFTSFLSGYNNLYVGNVVRFDVPGITLGTTYHYRVRAQNACGTSASSSVISYITYAPGATGPGGGIVFYDKGFSSGGWRYLEMSLSDVSTSAPFGCNVATPITGADGWVEGTGEANTTQYATGCADSGTASKLCDNLVQGGFSNWFLPSIEEMRNFFRFKDTAITPVTLHGNGWWTSTEAGSSGYEITMSTGVVSAGNKSNGRRVRCARGF